MVGQRTAPILTSLIDPYRTLGGGWIEHTGDSPRPPEALS
jgi:multidrug efflux system outer membrane protein